MSALLLLVSSLASAGSVETWSDEDFGNGDPIVGSGGWDCGYNEDDWYGYYVDFGAGTESYVFSATDDNGGSFGSGDAADNWVVNSNIDSTDGYIVTTAWTLDDDTWGLVFNFEDDQNYNMLALVGGEYVGDGAGAASNPFGFTELGMFLLRIEGGSVTVLDSTGTYYPYNSIFKLAAGSNDGTVWGKVWFDPDAAWSDTDVDLSASDRAGFSGSAGFYAYDMGGLNRDDSYAGFGPIFHYAYDEDDDGVIDDEDNCEDVANPDQEDADGNGVGTACDPDEAGADAGGDAGTDAGADAGTDAGADAGGDAGTDAGADAGADAGTGDDTGATDGAGDVGGGGDDSTGDVGSDPLDGTGQKGGELSACSCNGTGSAAGGLVFAMIAALRRRRRSTPSAV